MHGCRAVRRPRSGSASAPATATRCVRAEVAVSENPCGDEVNGAPLYALPQHAIDQQASRAGHKVAPPSLPTDAGVEYLTNRRPPDHRLALPPGRPACESCHEARHRCSDFWSAFPNQSVLLCEIPCSHQCDLVPPAVQRGPGPFGFGRFRRQGSSRAGPERGRRILKPAVAGRDCRRRPARDRGPGRA